jgi:uncharacterized protein (DUF4415 family)
MTTSKQVEHFNHEEQARQEKSSAEASREASSRRSPGGPRLMSAKEAVTLRVDTQTIERFKATGGDWRAKMAETLEQANAG